MSECTCQRDTHTPHPCRLLLGARAAAYPGIPDNFDAQHLSHSRRIGRPLDLVQAFANPRQLPFDDRYVAMWARNRPGSTVIHCWKPVAHWSHVERPDDRARIAMAARRISRLNKPVMLVLHHEPENDRTRRGVRTLGYGTPKDYRRMWAVVRDLFAEANTTNVTWGMAYMNYPKWDAVVADLWPGDDLVDWLWCNAYGSVARPDIAENLTHFIDLVDEAGIGQHLPWGVREWGAVGLSRNAAVDYFHDAADFLDTDDAARLNAWVVFDSPGAHQQSGLRLAYDDLGRPHPEKLDAYKAFTHHHAFSCRSIGGAEVSR